MTEIRAFNKIQNSYQISPGAAHCHPAKPFCLQDVKRPLHNEPLDARPMIALLLSYEFVKDDIIVRQLVNPSHEDKVALYACSGADWSNFILSTDAKTAYFVDLATPKIDRLRKIMAEDWEQLDSGLDYHSYKFFRGYAAADSMGMVSIEAKLLMELKSMGVDKNTIMIEACHGGVNLTFDWAYVGQKSKRYSITYIKADITNPNNYPELLRRTLAEGIDIYYERAALNTPAKRGNFLPQIEASIKAGGFLITDETDRFDGSPDLERFIPNVIRIGSSELAQKKQRPDYLSADSAGYGWRSQVHQVFRLDFLNLKIFTHI